ncbi:hypothetical protein AK812_SmicGene46172, partial [Symbiodinium microadriaticum]
MLDLRRLGPGSRDPVSLVWAIEKWLSMHNTSPMTGAVLAHRYLTENFALRHLIETYEAQLSEKRTTEGRRAGVSKTCISPPLSELSDE